MKRNSPVSKFLAIASFALLAAIPAHAQFTANVSSLTFPNVSNPSNTNIAFFTLDSTPRFAPFSINVTTQNGVAWLAANSVGGGSVTLAQVQVTVTPTLLAPGTYNGNVIVTSPTGQFTQLSIPVSLQVTSGGGTGGLTLNPTSMTFNYTSGQATPLSQPLSISTTTSTTFQATPSSTGWLSLSQTSGGPGTFAQINVVANPLGLGTGTYQGSVTVTAGGSTQQLPITLNVNTGGGTGANPTSLTFSYTPGGSLPNSQTIFYTPPFSSSSNASVNTANGIGWLQVSPQFQGAGTQVTYTVSVSPTLLGTGSYTGNVVITPSSGTAVQVPVTLNIGTSGGGTTGVSPTSLSFTYTVGGLAPQQQFLSISAPVSTGFTATATTQNGVGWLAVQQSNGVTPGSIGVSVNPALLGPGSYPGQIQVSVNGQLFTVPVNIVVNSSGSSGGSVSLSPSSTSFSYTPGGSLPNSQTLVVTAPAGLSYSASTQVASGAFNWLSISPTNGITSSQFGLTMSILSPQSLAQGTYTGTVTVQVQGQQAVVSQVTLFVGTGGGGTGAVSLSPSSIILSYTPGGSAPQNQLVTLTTPSPTTFTTQASTSSGGTWLQVGPQTGATQSNGGLAQGQFSVGTLTSTLLNLPTGSYTGTVQVNTSQGNATLNVTLNVGTGGGGGGGGATTGSVSPASLTFNYQSGTTAPGPQIVTVNTLNGASGTFTASPSTNPSLNWLNVTPLSGSAPGVFAVSVNPNVVGVGSYNGTVNVVLSGSGTSMSVPVTLNVASTPVLKTDLTSATFNYQIGGVVPAGQAQNVQLTSSGTAVVATATAQVTSPAGGTWLSVSPQTITTPAAVSVGINASGLNAGTYTGTVFFSVSGQSTVAFPVTLNVSTAPLLNVSPGSLSFNSPPGSGSPGAQTFNLSSTGAAVTVQPSVVTMNGSGWLSVSPNSLTTTGQTFTVNVNQSGLVADTYYGAVIINTSPAGQAGNAPVVIPVVYVNGTSSSGGGGGSTTFTVSPTSLTFSQVPNGAAPPSQTVNVTAPSFTTYNATFSPQTGGNWLSISPITGTTPGSFTASVNGAGLSLGSYSGFIIVTPSSGTQQVIPVSLQVINAPTMTVSPSSLTFDYQVGGTSSASQTISVGATSAGIASATVNYNATFFANNGGSWLSVTPQSGVTPSSMTVTVNPAGLPLGTYTGSITIQSVATNSPVTIPVTLNVRNRSQVLSQLADGASWKTTITLVNLDTTGAQFTLRFYADDGTPLSIATDAAGGRVNSIDGTIPVNGSRTIQTLGNDANLSQGWVELTTTARINGNAVFRQRVEGRADQEGAVSLTSTTNRFVLPFDNTENYVTSMAIMSGNASQSVVVSLIMRDEAGNQFATDTLTLGARSHQAFALTDRLPTTRGRRGTVEFSTTNADITGLGLRFTPGGSFTSFPVQPK